VRFPRFSSSVISQLYGLETNIQKGVVGVEKIDGTSDLIQAIDGVRQP